MSGELVTAESIESRIEADPNSGCWLWCGYLGERGYGRITTPDGQSRLAHRVSYEVHKGSAEGFFVLHRCDTPQCVNPAHLRLGTHQDNVDDRDRRGRWRGRVGAVVPITAEARADIEQNCVTGSLDAGIRTFARKYGVRPSSVAYIIARRGQKDSRRKLTDAQVSEIRLRLADESGVSLAAEFGVHPYAITLIRQGKRWKS
jgi:hypothetical protein